MANPNNPTSDRQSIPDEEPALGSEPSVPLDGKDPQGERMMEDLGQERRRDGAAPAPEEDPTAQKGR